MAHLTGTAQDDTYTGTAVSDLIEGFGGDDVLYDGPSSTLATDEIFCGDGDDVAGTRGGADTIDGGFGQDQLVIGYEAFSTSFILDINENTGNSLSSSNGLSFTSIEKVEFRLGSGDDTVYSGGGDDTFVGNGGNDTFLGRGGSDVGYGGVGEDHLHGGAGRDTLFGEADDDALYGNSGNDSLSGGIGSDELHGGGGDDYMTGNAGADQLYGDTGIDSVSYYTSTAGVIVDLAAGTGDNGDAEGDTYGNIEAIYGSSFGDTLIGSGNFDALSGEGGSDVLRGGAGADHLDGGTATDTASYYTGSVGVDVNLATGIGQLGEAEGDTLSSIENLSGSQGHDELVGNVDANTLQGWNGNDLLTGAGGKDTFTGGAGGDYFIYAAIGDSLVGANADRITDFSHAQGDWIDLAAIDANTGVAGGQAFSFIGTGLYTGVAGQLRYAVAGGVTTIAGDVNGNGTSDFHIQLTGAIALVAGDFAL
jgi:Ca2+-binding RTX toxin-like protein